MESDLLLDVDGMGPRSEALTDVLKSRNYVRLGTLRWKKETGGAVVMLDLFHAENANLDYAPTGSTRLPGGDRVLARAKKLTVLVRGSGFTIAVPDPIGFLTMKIAAKMEVRPKETKDCFDLYAYVWLIGIEVIRDALERAGEEGEQIRARLRALFADSTSPGVNDILGYATHLGKEEQDLLAQAVVDTMTEATRAS